MDDPLVLAAVISVIGLVATAIIGGTFALLRNNRRGIANPSILADGLLAALQTQTKALGDLTEVLRGSHREDRQSHEKMLEGITTLLERTGRNPRAKS